MTAKSLDTVPASHGDQPLEAAAVLAAGREHLANARPGGLGVLASVTDPARAARGPEAPPSLPTATYPDDTKCGDDRRAEAP